MRPLIDVQISLEQAYVKILADLKLLKMVYANVFEFDVAKYVMKFRSTNVHVYAISGGPKIFEKKLLFSSIKLTFTVKER